MRGEGIALEQTLLCIDEQQRAYIEQLKSFIRIPSVSTGADGDTGDSTATGRPLLVIITWRPSLFISLMMRRHRALNSAAGTCRDSISTPTPKHIQVYR